MTCENSPKTKALQMVCGKPWWLVAQDWQAAALPQAEVARRWTALVQPFVPQVRFNQRDVSRIFTAAAARREREEVAA